MSRLLRELEPPSDEDSYDDDEEVEYNEEDDDYYDDDDDEEVEEEAPVNLLDLATSKKKVVQQTPSVKDGSTKKPKSKRRNKFTLDDDLPSKSNVKIGDVSEKEYYDNLLLDPETLNKKKRALENVHFLLSVRTSVMMNWDRVKPLVITVQTLSQLWMERYAALCKDLSRINKEREEKGLKRINTLQLEKRVTDKNNTLLSKFEKKVMTVDSLDHSYVQHCLRRVNFAATSVNGVIWVHGGSNGKNILDDFWCYDPVKNHITLFQNITDKNDLKTPPMHGHKMFHLSVQGTDRLLIIGEDIRNRDQWGYRQRTNPLRFYYISNVTNPDDIMMGAPAPYGNNLNSIHFSHPVATIGTTIPACSFFSAVLLGKMDDGYDILLFGGQRRGAGHSFDMLYHIHIRPNHYAGTNNPSYTYAAHQLVKKGSTWPSPRYGHAAVALNGNMILFGGKSQNKSLNDLYFYNTQTGYWTEIDVTGPVPPGLAFCGCFSYSVQTMFIYGGLRADGRTSDSLYSYNTGTQKWNVVKVLGYGSSANSSAQDIQTPRYGMECVPCDNQMFRIGGKYQDRVTGDIFSLSNIQDPGHDYSLSVYLKKIRAEQTLADVIFRVKEVHDSEKSNEQLNDADVIHEYYAHRCVLYARCDYLTELVNESTNMQETENHDDVFGSVTKVVVDIEDCNATVFDAYLHYLYSGEVLLSGLSNIKQLLAICEKWSPEKHLPLLAEICDVHSDVNLELTERVIGQFASDFEKLVDNPEASDLGLTLGGTEESTYMSVHKVLICRSEFFKNMLRSGMQESFADSIELLEYNKDVMIEIIRYCYTDQIHLTTDNAIGLMMTSTMFNLPGIANSCRNLVGQCLTLDNVCKVMEIAETYADSALKRTCYPFMRDNYDDLIHSNSFLLLSPETRLKIQEIAAKKKKQLKK